MVTCDTPPVASTAGFTIHSAIVRRSIIEVLSLCSPTKRISPITLDCGASTGVMPSGSTSDRVTIFSDTICLALKTSMPQSNSTHTKE